MHGQQSEDSSAELTLKMGRLVRKPLETTVPSVSETSLTTE